jgi:diamine N-acetyltransferase
MLRPARPGDARNLAALSIQVWLHTYATEGLREALATFVLTEFTEARFQQRIAEPRHRVLVEERAGHLVGYADLDFEAPRKEARVELATLYVQEHFAGRGIGSQLLAACAEEARQRCGCPDLWLSVYHRNERAIAFYRNQGFTECGSFPFEFGGERHLNLILARLS